VIDQIDTQIIMQVMQSGRQTLDKPYGRLSIFRRTCIRQPFSFGRTRTRGYLILAVRSLTVALRTREL